MSYHKLLEVSPTTTEWVSPRLLGERRSKVWVEAVAERYGLSLYTSWSGNPLLLQKPGLSINQGGFLLWSEKEPYVRNAQHFCFYSAPYDYEEGDRLLSALYTAMANGGCNGQRTTKDYSIVSERQRWWMHLFWCKRHRAAATVRKRLRVL